MMQDVMEGLSLAGWLLTLCSLIFVVIINLYWIKRNGFYVNVNCWFCNSWTKVLYSNRNSFVCPSCEQYNGFDKDGGYNRVIEAQHCRNISNDKTIKKTERYTNGLCNYCNNNQQLKVFQLANFTPINDYNYDLEVEHFQKQLEKSYKLCKKCEKVVETSIKKKNAWVFGNNFKNLYNKSLSLMDLSKASKGIEKTLKLHFCDFIRYTLIVFTVLILCQLLNIKVDVPIPSIRKIAPRIFESYKLVLKDTVDVWMNVKKHLGDKLNISSYTPVNLKMKTNELVPLTSVGFFLDLILVFCDKKSVWWKINGSLGWALLILSSALSVDSYYSVFINALQVISSLGLLYSYMSHEPKEKVKRASEKFQFKKIVRSNEDSSEEGIEDILNSSDSSVSTYQALNTSQFRSYPATTPFRCYQNKIQPNQSFASAKSDYTASVFNRSYDVPNSDLNISMDNLNLNDMNLIPQPCSSPIFSVSSARRPLLSPAELKNITQNPWAAGGFWKNDSQILSAPVQAANFSRSSSQSSGFISNNLNSPPASGEHSVGGDLERNSVLSEPAYHFSPINASSSQQLYYKADNNTFYPVLGQNSMLFIQNGVPQQSNFGNQSLRSYSTAARSPLSFCSDKSRLFKNLHDPHCFRKPYSS